MSALSSVTGEALATPSVPCISKSDMRGGGWGMEGVWSASHDVPVHHPKHSGR